MPKVSAHATLSEWGAELSEWTIAPHTCLVKYPFDLRTQLGAELAVIHQREVSEPYYRGETDVQPSEDSNSDSDSDSDSDSMGPASSPPSSLPPSSSPAPLSSSPASLSWSEVASPPSSSPYGGPPRYTPYPLQPPRKAIRGILTQRSWRLPLVSLRPSPERPLPLTTMRPYPTGLTRAHLRRMDFRVFDWNLEATPWIDREERVLAVFLGSPIQTRAWDDKILDATQTLAEAENTMDRRFLVDDALRDGVNYRNGRPRNTKHALENLMPLASLRLSPGIKGIISFQNEMYRHFFPKMWSRAVTTINTLREHNRELRLPFDPRFGEQIPPTAWTSVEYQFAATDGLPRRDDRDSVYGMRAITSVGTYDSRYTYSGDVVFHGSKFVAPFPSGSTFIFPAWWMPYSFTLVDRDETHYVIMQHMDAGLDRFVQNEFQSDPEYEQSRESRTQDAVDARASFKANQLDEILSLFSNVKEFPSGVNT